MKLVPKVDDKGNVVIDADGKIVFIDTDDDNKEYPLDGGAMYVKILDLGQKNKTQREKRKEAEDTLKLFSAVEGINMEDPTEWITSATGSIKTVKNLDDKQLVDAGKVEEVKQEMRDAYESQLSAKDEAINGIKAQNEVTVNAKDGQIRKLMVSNRFNTSKYFNGEKSITTLPPDAAEALFGKNFQVVEEANNELSLKAFAADGKTELLSKINPGEPADFNEAVSLIIDKYPNRDSILRAIDGGSGGQGGQGGGGTPVNEISKLEAELVQAEKDGDPAKMVVVKNAIFAAKKANSVKV